MRPTLGLSLLLPLLALLPGCSKPRFTYEVEAAFQWSSYHSLAPDPRHDRVVIREGFRPMDPGYYREAVLTELGARSLSAVPAAEADLWVAVFVLAEGRSESPGGGAPKGSRRDGGGEGRHGGGRGGMGGGGGMAGGGTAAPKGEAWVPKGKSLLIVQLQDRRSGLPVWQGEANLVAGERTSDGRPLGPDDAVRQLLHPLPGRP